MRLRRRRLPAPGAMMVFALGLSTLSALGVPAFAPAPPLRTAPSAGPGAASVAFTDDADRLAQYNLDGTVFYGGSRPALVGSLPPAPHEGEASVSGGYTAFVRGTAAGSDVYLATPYAAQPLRITCSGTSSHPVPAVSVSAVAVPGSANGDRVADLVTLAWADDAPGAGNDGHWNIWITTVTAWDPALGTRAGTGCNSGATVSAVVAAPHPLAAQAGDNLWPAWRHYVDPSAPGNPTVGTLVYESTRDNPLGDLYEQAPAGPGALRRTDGSAGHVANTQPAVLDAPYGYGVTSYVLFTTTAFRPDGSLASIAPPAPDTATGAFTLTNTWTKGGPQSSEAAVAQGCVGNDCGAWVAYRSTAPNGFGDVTLTRATYRVGNPLLLGAGPGYPVTRGPAVAESHPAVEVVGERIVGVLVTRRAITAGLSAVPLAGGSRATLVAPAPDEDAVAYSPDAGKIAYSELVLDANQQPVSRRIVVAGADGANPVVQDFGQAADRSGSYFDFDSQPTWSPDGTRLAFIREQYFRGVTQQYVATPAQLFVATVGSSTANPVALPGAGRLYYDSHPSWAPSGDRIVLSRSALADISPTLLTAPNGPGYTVTTTVTNNGLATAVGVTVTLAVAAGATVSGAPGSCTVAAAAGQPTTVSCPVGDVAAGATSAAISFQVGTSATCGTPTYTINESAGSRSADFDRTDKDASASVSFDLGVCINLATLPPPALTPATPALTPLPAVPPAGVVTGIRAFPDPGGLTGEPYLWTVGASGGTGAPLRSAGAAAVAAAVPGGVPAWSPDGLHIAYAALGQIDLVTLTAVGGVVQVPETAATLTAVTGYDGDYVSGTGGTPMPSRAALSAATDPAWTADGSEIVFAGQPAGQPDNSGIYAVHPDGTGLRTVAQGPQPETAPNVEPVRTPPSADVAVTVTVSQPVGYVGGPMTATITVRNLGPQAAPVTLQAGFTAALQPSGTPACLAGGTPCAIGTLAAGGSASFVVNLLPQPVGNPAQGYAATITATVGSPLPDPVPANNSATAALPVRQPRVQVLPGVQMPGFVALAYGQDFPPGAPVTLAWQPGITTYGGPFTVAADGTLNAPMLVVGRDVLGPRVIVATSVGGKFSPVQATMLVVPRTEAPPGFLGRG
ncbi:MAG: hypothetical protein EPN43_13785 [Jatrophihabitans sp.]|nr:MAG: hypothetical protein EPN43_13785 [Jatrophihabitans sp.]